jgi:hypothetical protein
MSALDAVRHPVSALPVVARIDIPGFPDWVGIDEVHPAVWISNRDRNNVARIDPATNTVVAHASVGHGPCSGLAIGHGSVWVPCCPDHEIGRGLGQQLRHERGLARRRRDGYSRGHHPGRSFAPVPRRGSGFGLGAQSGGRYRLADCSGDQHGRRHDRPGNPRRGGRYRHRRGRGLGSPTWASRCRGSTR